jgi:DHA2 family multidrug resistance protein-like MFS transporter
MQRATRREWLGLGMLALPCLLYSMDLTVLDLAVPRLTEALRPSSTQLLWIVDIYGFMVAGSLITMGALGDRIGRRRLLLIGAVAFGVASLAAAFAQSATQLIVARALLGIAGATIAPSTLAIVRHMFRDPAQRATAVGIWVASFSTGGALGPMLGGLLLSRLWWGSVFLLAVPVMILLLVFGRRLLPESRDDRAGRIDLVGAALSIVAVLATIYGAKRIAASGFDLVACASIFVGVALGIGFVRRQTTSADPVLDVKLFHNGAFTVSFLIYVLGAFAAFGTLFEIAQYLQLVLGLDPIAAGLWTAPSGIAFASGSLLSPWLARWIARRHIIAGGLVLGAIGLGVLARVDGTSLGQVLVGYLVFGVGLSLTFALAVDVVVASAPPERAGSASALAETGSELGGAVGIALLGSLVNVMYRSGMPTGVAAAARETIGGAVATAADLPAPLARPLLDSARAAFVHGMHASCAICAIALLVGAAVALRERSCAEPLPLDVGVEYKATQV